MSWPLPVSLLFPTVPAGSVEIAPHSKGQGMGDGGDRVGDGGYGMRGQVTSERWAGRKAEPEGAQKARVGSPGRRRPAPPCWQAP